MKRWIRPILAVLLGALAMSCLGILPAQAAKPVPKTETVVTYRGYTLAWSEADASDLRVVRTPGRPESFPAKASDRSISLAKARVTDAAQQRISEDSTDACNFVPDSFGDADFTDACDAHDACYSNTDEISRFTCDLIFFGALLQACSTYDQPSEFGLRLTCNTIAAIYFVGVRLLGAAFYTGNGNPA
jgi:Prokaryotic phospholipase A2